MRTEYFVLARLIANDHNIECDFGLVRFTFDANGTITNQEDFGGKEWRSILYKSNVSTEHTNAMRQHNYRSYKGHNGYVQVDSIEEAIEVAMASVYRSKEDMLDVIEDEIQLFQRMVTGCL